MVGVSDFEDSFFAGLAIGFTAGMILLVIGLGAVSKEVYTNGFCAALGGSTLNSETCNVRGAVVEVKR